MSIPTLLIGYYHGLLLRDIDADQLTDKMCSTGLLTDHQQTVISSGHTVHHRNWLLLEYVRQLDPESLLKFCNLLQEKWPEISTQLIMGMSLVILILSIILTILEILKSLKSWRQFLNQARARCGRLYVCMYMCVFVCPPPGYEKPSCVVKLK